ncbi:uncharacterized protein LOC134197489 isoform X2 [Corticium candelabrum]|uniref:uncharacterized protein LOC134197489 isoform X2 n=1 Tax=Corticium candelabrum TaxID=121492 RepID=UPI002E261D7C|nr:uncharacterized protein LOC134197489 isoform X2 [Corticium candelabrum]
MENTEFLPSTSSVSSLSGFSIDSFSSMSVDEQDGDEDAGYRQIRSTLAVTEMELRREMAEIQEAQERELEPSALPDYHSAFQVAEVDEQGSAVSDVARMRPGVDSDGHEVSTALNVPQTAIDSVTSISEAVLGTALPNVRSTSSALFDTSSAAYPMILDSSLLDSCTINPQWNQSITSVLPLTSVESFDSRINSSTIVRRLDTNTDISNRNGVCSVAVVTGQESAQNGPNIGAVRSSWTNEATTVDVGDLVAESDGLGSSNVKNHSVNTAAMIHDKNFNVSNASTDDSQKPKRRGGWPKGKKRKKTVLLLNPPKAPVTGYIHFLNAKRAEVKKSHPDITYAEVTRLLGAEWSSLCSESKQKYLVEAELDKKRYVQELESYKQSKEYQDFVKRRKSLSDGLNHENEGDPLSDAMTEPESSELFCKACNQYFSSLHNKKEHLLGKQHLQVVTGEFRKQTQSSHLSRVSTYCLDFENSIPKFVEDFLQCEKMRGLEICVLRQSLTSSQEKNNALKLQLHTLEESVKRLNEKLLRTKALGTKLVSELSRLKQVLMAHKNSESRNLVFNRMIAILA